MLPSGHLKKFRVLLLWCLLGLGISAKCDSIPKSPNPRWMIDGSYSGVMLDPVIREERGPHGWCSKEDVDVMVDLISSRFSSVMPVRDIKRPIEGEDEEDDYWRRGESCTAYIPMACAKLNLNKADNKHTLEAILLVGEVDDRRKNRTESTIADMKYTLELATKANQLYPGTVSTILINDFRLDCQKDIAHTSQSLVLKESKALAESSGIAIGIFMDLEKDCDAMSSYLPPRTKYLLGLVDTVVFRDRPYPDQSGAKNDMKAVSQEMDNCKEKIKREVDHTVNIVFTTAWLGHRQLLGQQLDGGTVRYGLHFAKWAAKTHNKVLLYGAFDAPFARIDGQSWWSVKNHSFTDVSKELFEEKAEHVYFYEDHELD